MNRIFRRFPPLVCLLVLIAGPAALAEPRGDQPAAEQSSSSRLVGKMWWNQPAKFEPLGLSAEKRARMDELAEKFLAQRSENIEAQRQAYAALGEALAADDATLISQRAEAVKTAVSATAAAQVDMIVEVTALLTDEQRQRLLEIAPKLLYRQWIRSGRGPGRR